MGQGPESFRPAIDTPYAFAMKISSDKIHQMRTTPMVVKG